MNPQKRADENPRVTATYANTVDSGNGHRRRAMQVNAALSQKCVICGDPTAERCFCKIHRQAAEPVLLCCPDCALQYLESASPPAHEHEQELRSYEKSSHFFIGEDKPWS